MSHETSFYSSMSKISDYQYNRTYLNLNLIFESFYELKIASLEHLPNLENIPENFWKKKSKLHEKLLEKFSPNLNEYEITYIAFVLLEEIECFPEYFLNVFDIMKNILSHFRYSLNILYKKKKTKLQQQLFR